MQVQSSDTQHINSILEDGATIGLEVRQSNRGIDELSSDAEHPFKDIADSIESLANAVKTTLKKVRPQKASVEFGIEFAAEQGKLLAVVVRGEGKANMKLL